MMLRRISPARPHIQSPQSIALFGHFWGLILGPSELARPTKVLEYDESALLDVPEMLWAHPFLQELAALRPCLEPVWPFTTAQL